MPLFYFLWVRFVGWITVLAKFADGNQTVQRKDRQPHENGRDDERDRAHGGDGHDDGDHHHDRFRLPMLINGIYTSHNSFELVPTGFQFHALAELRRVEDAFPFQGD